MQIYGVVIDDFSSCIIS